MYSYLMRRMAFGVVTVIGVSIIVFMVLRILPGDPLVAIFGPEGYTKLSEAERAHYMAELGLSDPLAMQYLNWVGEIARGNFGRSFFRAESVGDMILRRGPLTAEIGIIAVILSWIVGIPLAGAALWADPWANLQIVIGPAVVLGLGQAAYIARMARSSLLEVIREDYVRTARAKGLSRRPVIAFHALPNALLPVITLSGILLGFVLAGSIPVERAFGTPGLGYAMFTAVSERDVFVMQNLVFLYAVVFVALNILVDVTIAWLDPRIRYQ